MKNGKWIKKWEVESSSGNGKYVVSLSDKGIWGCSCPVWKFRRQECHHIKQIKLAGGNPKPEIKKPEYTLAKVLKPTLKNGKLLIPLVPIGDVRMSATICYVMLKNGYSWSEIKKIRKLSDSWTKQKVLVHIEQYGEYTYPKNFWD